MKPSRCIICNLLLQQFFLLCLHGQAFTKNTELKGARIYSGQFEKHIIIVKQYLQSNSSSKDECC